MKQMFHLCIVLDDTHRRSFGSVHVNGSEHKKDSYRLPMWMIEEELKAMPNGVADACVALQILTSKSVFFNSLLICQLCLPFPFLMFEESCICDIAFTFAFEQSVWRTLSNLRNRFRCYWVNLDPDGSTFNWHWLCNYNTLPRLRCSDQKSVCKNNSTQCYDYLWFSCDDWFRSSNRLLCWTWDLQNQFPVWKVNFQKEKKSPKSTIGINSLYHKGKTIIMSSMNVYHASSWTLFHINIVVIIPHWIESFSVDNLSFTTWACMDARCTRVVPICRAMH